MEVARKRIKPPTKKPRVCYLSGGIRKVLNHREICNEAATQLRRQGHQVFNPCEKAGEMDGDDCDLDYLRRVFFEDFKFLICHADSIAMLPFWELSKGAVAEHAMALALGLEIIYLKKPRSEKKPAYKLVTTNRVSAA